MTQKYNILDLFCGAGGFSLGLKMTNRFNITGAIDHWEPAIETFRYNNPHLPVEKIICDDITKIFNENF